MKNNVVKYSQECAPNSFSTLIDQFFNNALTRNGGSVFVPQVDVIERENAYQIQVAAPGLKKEDFNIELHENQITVSGERKFSTEDKEENYHRIETQYGSFSRSFQLPDHINGGKINAEYNNGILELTIPKDEKKVQKQVIKVS